MRVDAGQIVTESSRLHRLFNPNFREDEDAVLPSTRPECSLLSVGRPFPLVAGDARAVNAETGSQADGGPGPARAHERVDGRADEEGVAERRPDSGEQLWSEGRGRPGRDKPRRRPAALDRFRLRHRRRRLHHDQRACCERRAARPGRAAQRRRRRDAEDGADGKVHHPAGAHRRDHHRAGSRAAEGGRHEVAGRYRWRRTRKFVRARQSLRSAARSACATA